MNYKKKNFFIEYLVFSIIRNFVSKINNGFYVTLVQARMHINECMLTI